MYSFLSKHRIRSSDEFDVIFKCGKRFHNRCFTLIVVSTECDYPRLGIVISKKNCQLAVNRNRIKRKVREHFRLNQAILSGKDIVVLLRSSTKNINDQEQSACIVELFSQCAGYASV